LYVAQIPYESFETREVYLKLEIPERNLVAIALPKIPPPLDNLEDKVLESIENPVAGPKLTELLGRNRKLTIIVDNQFRPTPAHRILPPILDVAEDKKADITLIFACGAVPPLTPEEMEAKIGKKAIERIGKEKILNNEAKKRENYIFKGITSHGTPVWVHRVVATADVIIGIGLVQAEPFAGYGGGGKIILPGVCSIDTIEANHRMTISPKVYPGSLENPVRYDIEEAADLAGLDMVIDVVMNVKGEVVGIYAGEHRRTFRKAVEEYDKIYRVKLPTLRHRKADITITGTFWPTDHLYFHTGWAVNNCDLVTRDGGTIIHASPCPGYKEWPGFVLMDLMKEYMPPSRENLEMALIDIVTGKKEMWCGCIWFKFYEVLTRKNVIIVTEKENIKFARDIGLNVKEHIEEAFGEAIKMHGKDARIVLMPYGKWTLPEW